MAKKPNPKPAMVLFDVFYEDGAQSSNRRVPDSLLTALDSEIKTAKQEADNQAGSIGKIFKGPESRGEAIGNTLIALLLPAFQKMQGAADRSEQFNRNQQLAFALAAYRADKGKYPAKLDELAPDYLRSVPNDLYSGQPMIYRLMDTGYLLYSVGLNGIDDGGRSFGDDPRGDDPRVRMPVPEPKAVEKWRLPGE